MKGYYKCKHRSVQASRKLRLSDNKPALSILNTDFFSSFHYRTISTSGGQRSIKLHTNTQNFRTKFVKMVLSFSRELQHINQPYIVILPFECGG